MTFALLPLYSLIVFCNGACRRLGKQCPHPKSEQASRKKKCCPSAPCCSLCCSLWCGCCTNDLEQELMSKSPGSPRGVVQIVPSLRVSELKIPIVSSSPPSSVSLLIFMDDIGTAGGISAASKILGKSTSVVKGACPAIHRWYICLFASSVSRQTCLNIIFPPALLASSPPSLLW